jgi:hypothetical protein
MVVMRVVLLVVPVDVFVGDSMERRRATMDEDGA